LDTLKVKNNNLKLSTLHKIVDIIYIDYKLLSFTWENLNCNYLLPSNDLLAPTLLLLLSSNVCLKLTTSIAAS